MVDFSNHVEVLDQLRKSQSVDKDRREKVREIEHFLDDPDGQWEPGIIERFINRPRYTFDLCNPVVEDIWSEIAQNDFDVRVKPAGGDATKELAKTYDGLVRNIEAMSNAVDDVYAPAAKATIRTGFAAWRIKQDWADVDAFEQDLFVELINNAVDRVWFDQGAEKRSMEDAKFCFVLTAITPDEYQRRWPKGSMTSIGDPNSREVYTRKKEQIKVAEFIYKEPVNKKLFQMSNGAVYDETTLPVQDELAQLGITVVRERTRKTFKVKTRFMDGNDWLDDAKDTVFDMLPIIPVYSNFKISESKVIYFGAIEKLIDAQRVYNYAESRKVEEVALAPRKKTWMTQDQAAGHESKLQTMNTNADPVQFYNPDQAAPPPFETGGPTINPGLSEVSQGMVANIERTSGQFGVNPQNNRGLQSNVALQTLENRGNSRTLEYFKALQVAICQTGKVLIHALPKAYDTSRQQRVLNEDGSFELVPINSTIIDQNTRQPVVVNDLSQGIYDVTCDIGPAFKNRQEEAAKAIIDLGAVDPTIIQMGKDILLNNLQSPGMDLLAERARQQMFQQGAIPETQMTDDEQAQLQQALALQAQQGEQIDPVQQAILEQTQANTADIQSKAQERADKTQLELLKIQQRERELDSKDTESAIKAQLANEQSDREDIRVDQSQQKIDQDQLMQAFQIQQQQNKMLMDEITARSNELKTLADTFKTIREGMGADVFTGPNIVEAGIQQAQILNDRQDEVLGGNGIIDQNT